MPDTATYSRLSRFNHWIAAAVMIFMLGLGLYLEYGGLAREARGPVMGVHMAVGTLFLAFAVWRVCWRLVKGFPMAVGPMPRLQEITARVVHWALLALLVLMPLTGVVAKVFDGRSIAVFELFTVPAIESVKWLADAAHAAHGPVAYLLVILILVHVAGALKHAFVDRDGTLRRMVTGHRRDTDAIPT